MKSISKAGKCQRFTGCKGKGLKFACYPEELILLKHYSPPLFDEKNSKNWGQTDLIYPNAAKVEDAPGSRRQMVKL